MMRYVVRLVLPVAALAVITGSLPVLPTDIGGSSQLAQLSEVVGGSAGLTGGNGNTQFEQRLDERQQTGGLDFDFSSGGGTLVPDPDYYQVIIPTPPSTGSAVPEETTPTSGGTPTTGGSASGPTVSTPNVSPSAVGAAGSLVAGQLNQLIAEQLRLQNAALFEAQKIEDFSGALSAQTVSDCQEKCDAAFTEAYSYCREQKKKDVAVCERDLSNAYEEKRGKCVTDKSVCDNWNPKAELGGGSKTAQSSAGVSVWIPEPTKVVTLSSGDTSASPVLLVPGNTSVSLVELPGHISVQIAPVTVQASRVVEITQISGGAVSHETAGDLLAAITVNDILGREQVQTTGGVLTVPSAKTTAISVIGKGISDTVLNLSQRISAVFGNIGDFFGALVGGGGSGGGGGAGGAGGGGGSTVTSVINVENPVIGGGAGCAPPTGVGDAAACSETACRTQTGTGICQLKTENVNGYTDGKTFSTSKDDFAKGQSISSVTESRSSCECVAAPDVPPTPTPNLTCPKPKSTRTASAQESINESITISLNPLGILFDGSECVPEETCVGEKVTGKDAYGNLKTECVNSAIINVCHSTPNNAAIAEDQAAIQAASDLLEAEAEAECNAKIEAKINSILENQPALKCQPPAQDSNGKICTGPGVKFSFNVKECAVDSVTQTEIKGGDGKQMRITIRGSGSGTSNVEFGCFNGSATPYKAPDVSTPTPPTPPPPSGGGSGSGGGGNVTPVQIDPVVSEPKLGILQIPTVVGNFVRENIFGALFNVTGDVTDGSLDTPVPSIGDEPKRACGVPSSDYSLYPGGIEEYTKNLADWAKLSAAYQAGAYENGNGERTGEQLKNDWERTIREYESYLLYDVSCGTPQAGVCSANVMCEPYLALTESGAGSVKCGCAGSSYPSPVLDPEPAAGGGASGPTTGPSSDLPSAERPETTGETEISCKTGSISMVFSGYARVTYWGAVAADGKTSNYDDPANTAAKAQAAKQAEQECQASVDADVADAHARCREVCASLNTGLGCKENVKPDASAAACSPATCGNGTAYDASTGKTRWYFDCTSRSKNGGSYASSLPCDCRQSGGAGQAAGGSSPSGASGGGTSGGGGVTPTAPETPVAPDPFTPPDPSTTPAPEVSGPTTSEPKDIDQPSPEPTTTPAPEMGISEGGFCGKVQFTEAYLLAHYMDFYNSPVTEKENGDDTPIAEATEEQKVAFFNEQRAKLAEEVVGAAKSAEKNGQSDKERADAWQKEADKFLGRLSCGGGENQCKVGSCLPFIAVSGSGWGPGGAPSSAVSALIGCSCGGKSSAGGASSGGAEPGGVPASAPSAPATAPATKDTPVDTCRPQSVISFWDFILNGFKSEANQEKAEMQCTGSCAKTGGTCSNNGAGGCGCFEVPPLVNGPAGDTGEKGAPAAPVVASPDDGKAPAQPASPELPAPTVTEEKSKVACPQPSSDIISALDSTYVAFFTLLEQVESEKARLRKDKSFSKEFKVKLESAAKKYSEAIENAKSNACGNPPNNKCSPAKCEITKMVLPNSHKKGQPPAKALIVCGCEAFPDGNNPAGSGSAAAPTTSVPVEEKPTPTPVTPSTPAAPTTAPEDGKPSTPTTPAPTTTEKVGDQCLVEADLTAMGITVKDGTYYYTPLAGGEPINENDLIKNKGESNKYYDQAQEMFARFKQLCSANTCQDGATKCGWNGKAEGTLLEWCVCGGIPFEGETKSPATPAPTTTGKEELRKCTTPDTAQKAVAAMDALYNDYHKNYGEHFEAETYYDNNGVEQKNGKYVQKIADEYFAKAKAIAAAQVSCDNTKPNECGAKSCSLEVSVQGCAGGVCTQNSVRCACKDGDAPTASAPLTTPGASAPTKTPPAPTTPAPSTKAGYGEICGKPNGNTCPTNGCAELTQGGQPMTCALSTKGECRCYTKEEVRLASVKDGELAEGEYCGLPSNNACPASPKCPAGTTCSLGAKREKCFCVADTSTPAPTVSSPVACTYKNSFRVWVYSASWCTPCQIFKKQLPGAIANLRVKGIAVEEPQFLTTDGQFTDPLLDGGMISGYPTVIVQRTRVGSPKPQCPDEIMPFRRPTSPWGLNSLIEELSKRP